MKKIKEKRFTFYEGFQLHVVVQLFNPWFVFYFTLFWSMVMYDNEFETKEKKI